jgi:hypothetical protein
LTPDFFQIALRPRLNVALPMKASQKRNWILHRTSIRRTLYCGRLI